MEQTNTMIMHDEMEEQVIEMQLLSLFWKKGDAPSGIAKPSKLTCSLRPYQPKCTVFFSHSKIVLTGLSIGFNTSQTDKRLKSLKWKQC